MSGTKPKSEHPDIVLNSPVGKEPAIYKWPLLYTSAGNKIDGAVEIIDTIRWVANEFPQIQAAIENVLMTHSDYRSYETIRLICDKYNKIVDTTLKLFAGSSLTPGRSTKPSVGLVKHVIQQVYNYAVTDPDKLNQYQPFSSGVYGETSFEFISQMIEEINLTDQDIFIDLGSGVGQVVLQIAALTPCRLCFGIEKADVPAGYAETMSTRFKFWMAWHGKTYNEFQLIKGDFFDRAYEETVKNATFIFVNNFAFGPEVDHELKRRFIDLRDGTKIISSKRFCAPKTKVTERNLTDIGSIMNVREIQPEQKKDTVSWTDRPVSYYLHIIDGSRVERYYERLKRQQQRSDKKGKKVRRRKSSESLSNESDDGTFYGPTTRKAWSEWCNSTAHTSSSETSKTVNSNFTNNNSSNSTNNNNDRSENMEVDVLPKTSKKEDEKAKVAHENVIEESTAKPEPLPCVPIEVEEVHELPAPQVTILSTDETPKEDNSKPAKQSKLKLKLKLSLSKTGISIKKETPPKAAKASSKKKNAAAAAVLNLLHNKTVESVAGPSGYYPQPAQGCIEQKLDSYQETASMPDVVIRDISQWMPSGGFDKLVKDLKKSVKAFLTYMQSNEYKESICRKISEEQEKNRRLIKNDQELSRHVEHLSERLLGSVTKHCNELKVNPKEQDYGLKLYLSNFANLNMMSVSLVNEIDNLTNVNKMLQNRQAPKPGEPPAAHSRDTININNNNRFIPPRVPTTTSKSKATASLANHTNHAGSLKILDLSKNSNAVIKSPWIKL